MIYCSTSAALLDKQNKINKLRELPLKLESPDLTDQMVELTLLKMASCDCKVFFVDCSFSLNQRKR